jgi:hypothetical protein
MAGMRVTKRGVLAAVVLAVWGGSAVAQTGGAWHETGEFLQIDLPGEVVVVIDDANDTLLLQVLQVLDPATGEVAMGALRSVSIEPSPVQHDTEEAFVAAFVAGAQQGSCPDPEVIEFATHDVGGFVGKTILAHCEVPRNGGPPVFVIATTLLTDTREHAFAATIPSDNRALAEDYLDRLGGIRLCDIAVPGGPCLDR